MSGHGILKYFHPILDKIGRMEPRWVSQQSFDIIKKFPDLSLTEPTVRWLKILYLEDIAKKALDANSSEFNKLPYKKYGWPLNVGEEVDCQLQVHIKDLREASTPVNTAIVMATSKGIVMDKASDTSIASSDIYLTKDWAKYLMKHMAMVKRRAST